MNICVLDDYAGQARTCGDWTSLGPDVRIDFLTDPIPEADLPGRLADYAVLVVMRERTPFPAALLRQLPALRLLVTTGARNRSIDLDACREQGVVVCGTRSDPLLAAEQAWALIMALYKRVNAFDSETRDGRWQITLGHSLKGSTLGLLGLGKLGQRVAEFGRVFGMHVIAWSPNLTPERCAPHGVTYVDKPTLFSSADVVSVHMVSSPRTHGLVGDADFRRMRPGAFFVNTSRSAIADQAALCQVLRQGGIAGAALDVFDQEPLPPQAEVLHVPNLLLSPHMGYVSWQNYRSYYADAVDDIRGWLAGKPVRLLEH